AALLGEFGAMRGYLPQAAETYYSLALETNDLNIIKRAMEFSSALGNAEAMTELAQRWLALEPGAMDPHLFLGYQMIETGLYRRALPHMDTVLQLGGQVDFTVLSARTFNLEERQREVLITELTDMAQRYPQEPTLFYALSQMHDQSGHGEEARHWLQEARSRFGDNARTWLLEAQLLQNMGRTEAAEAVLAQAVEQYPENRLARYSYAQMLVQHNKLEEAIEQFEALIRQQPGDLETVYSMVLILLELQDYNRAEPRLRQLVNAGHRLNEASYYLAVILQSRGDRLGALGHYQQISRQSNAYLASQRQIINLLIELGRYDDAHAWGQQLIASDARLAPMVPALEAEALANAGQNERARDTLNAALEQYPDNTDLLFARTLISERFDDMEMIERDLRHILSIDPDDARALNHLGYALTIRTTRYEEALDLIQRASALQPEDPAITDSLGWVQYKLGNYEAALENLKKAYELFPDHEVAAHLGEVLWVSGDQSAALEIWSNALQEVPDSEFVTEAIERLLTAEQRSLLMTRIGSPT
ncbi:MAG TPA: tetratricopeptide repeat protein, partial [Pseudohongiella sp.]|nr:tetratricopeptide repeat protein [Pseudohongiella sp.]